MGVKVHRFLNRNGLIAVTTRALTLAMVGLKFILITSLFSLFLCPLENTVCITLLLHRQHPCSSPSRSPSSRNCFLIPSSHQYFTRFLPLEQLEYLSVFWHENTLFYGGGCCSLRFMDVCGLRASPFTDENLIYGLSVRIHTDRFCVASTSD